MLFCPQHLTPPAFVSAQVCVSPAAIAFTPLVNPVTLTGVSRCVCVLSPSCPAELSPQHLTPPPVVNAQEWLAPVAIAGHAAGKPDDVDRGRAAATIELSPSWPLSLEPQHLTPPAPTIAQVCSPPPDIALTVAAR